MNNYLIFIAGLALLVTGGEIMIRGAVAISRRLGIPSIVIGILIIGFGTSTPELTASILAVTSKLDAPGVAMGNVIGSNLANILLIVGVSAAIAPISGIRIARRDLIALLISAAAVAAAVILGNVSRILAAIMVLGMLIYIVCSAQPDSDGQDHQDRSCSIWRLSISIFMVIAGIAALLAGAHLMVTAAVKLAASFGVSDTIIGLTIVAIGTSLPELAASIIAAIHKESGLAVGNIIGSNIFNALLIPGAVALVKPFKVSSDLAFPLILMIAATAALLAALRSGRISRAGGAIMILTYAAYLIAIV